jgi:ribosomal protein S18 acetylase RimI-like enzyme
MTPVIRPFADTDEDAVVALWERCDLTRPWNDPHRDIERKRHVRPEWFLVAVDGDTVVGSVMAGYEGHRGWINYLAVDPGQRRDGLGRALMEAAEERLLAAGCPKINLQIRGGNTEAIAFYEAIGFREDHVRCFGKRLIPDAEP